jgi:hypothetical protein
VICDAEREIKGENSIRRLGLGSLGSGITALRQGEEEGGDVYQGRVSLITQQ